MTRPLASTDHNVARLPRPDREARVRLLVAEAHAILDDAIATHLTAEGKAAAGVVGLFSGGNDSTVLMHVMRDRLTHAAHANTGVGIEETRAYVRETCAGWGLPLLERAAPREVDSYRALVLDRGFPGPGQHFKMYQRLKERALDQVHRELVLNPRRERVLFVAGRRRAESARRVDVPPHERKYARVWVSPLVDWTKPDMTTYRLMQRAAGRPVPVNTVADLVHMSGECLCGAFAHRGEREEVSAWFPGAFELIAELEATIADRADIPEERRRWGWGAYRDDVKRSKSGPLCQSCDTKAAGGDVVVV